MSVAIAIAIAIAVAVARRCAAGRLHAPTPHRDLAVRTG
jgi:hypothetical protein